MPYIDSWFAKYRSRICAIVVLFTLVSKIKSMVLILPLTAGQTSKASPHVNGLAFPRCPRGLLMASHSPDRFPQLSGLARELWGSPRISILHNGGPLARLQSQHFAA